MAKKEVKPVKKVEKTPSDFCCEADYQDYLASKK